MIWFGSEFTGLAVCWLWAKKTGGVVHTPSILQKVIEEKLDGDQKEVTLSTHGDISFILLEKQGRVQFRKEHSLR